MVVLGLFAHFKYAHGLRVVQALLIRVANGKHFTLGERRFGWKFEVWVVPFVPWNELHPSVRVRTLVVELVECQRSRVCKQRVRSQLDTPYNISIFRLDYFLIVEILLNITYTSFQKVY